MTTRPRLNEEEAMRAISVLVVENSAADADSLVRELERSEWLVDHAVVNSERRLHEELAHRTWDLVVSDFALPGLSGLQALRIVKEADPNLPFICVSGTAGEEAAVAVLQAGADDFLVKGKLARLSLALERALREAAERKARNEAECAVRRSEERLRAVVDSMGDTVFTVDMELRHDRIFGRRATLSGFASTRLLGRTPLEVWGEDLGGAMQAAMKRALAGERTMHEWTVELSDAHLHFQTSYSALRSESGKTVGVVGTERDITLQKLTDARLLAADRMASVGILASGVAHEIKNPLAALAANVELACGELEHLDRLNTGANVEHTQVLSRLHAELNDARESSARIRDVVQDLGVLSRSDAEATHPVDLHMVLENALRVTANLTRHSATVVRKLGSIPPVLGDETRLGQLFRNLIMNAVASIPAGNADKNEIRITTSAVPGGDEPARGPRVVIEVIDTGRGMEESVARRLFTPFFTTKPVGAGIGLELAICHRIATALGGTISARSSKDGGSVFRVELPAADGVAMAQPAPSSQPSAAPPQRALRRGRVLLIDDDRLVLNTLSRVFEREHDAVATLSASEALTIVAEQGPFDVILCDLMMPNTSGMSFYEKLAKTSPRSAEKVVFMTGGAFNPDAQNFLAHVKNAHVAKPFDLDAVRALVRSRIEPREAGV
jgi:PAS domain S-box-containing protein